MAVHITSRSDAEAIIREQVISTIFQDAPKQSTFMSMARKLPNMTSNQTRMRVLDFLPTAYWVDGDTGMKQTTRQAWDNVYMNAAELAVIVPIPEAVLDDAEFDIFGEITPRVNEAIGQRVDSAIIFGINRPANWPNDIITLARQAGNNVAVGSSPDYYNLLLGEGGVISKVEEDGFMATGALASMSMRAKLRGIRATDGSLIFKSDMQGSTNYALDGAPLYFPQNGAYDNAIAQLIVGDFKQAVYSIRQDVTVKILDQGVIQDPITKEITYNLAQQDMVALRIVFRMGWALPNPATRMDTDRLGCPFAYLEPATPATTQKVTFTVKDNADTPAAVEGAVVDVNGSRKKTSATGIAEFNLREGSYPAKIKKAGYGTITETVVVADAAVDKEVTLIKQ
ncbi:phage major capsid protein [Hungatella hathewayi]|uniref:phage major capsid protein n=1 Tax=Hungatella TaxID=1649459 RepID=UPI000E438149|nr:MULTISPECIES: phage major capsid protein [Hungatella]RGO69264.1 phage major capsid protein [Hungatella hathewayi]